MTEAVALAYSVEGCFEKFLEICISCGKTVFVRIFFWWFMSAVMKIYMLMFYVLVYVYVLINNIVSILFIQAKFSFTFEMDGHNLPWSTDKFWVIICSSNNQPNGLSNLFKSPVKLIAGFITACLFSALVNHRNKSFKW